MWHEDYEIGNQVITPKGLGVIVGKREKNHLDSRQWWDVNLDSEDEYNNPHHFLERTLRPQVKEANR